MSEEFSQFVKIYGIKHIKSATYHPASNDQVERAVQTFKSKLRSTEKESGTLSQKLCRFLLHYRSSPHATTGISPSELFLGRQLRTRLFLLKPDVEESVREKQAKQLKEPAIARAVRQFRTGDLVWAQDYSSRSSKWTEGVIDSVLGPVTYQVRVENYLWKRHIDQLKARIPIATDVVMEKMISIQEPSTQSPPPV